MFAPTRSSIPNVISMENASQQTPHTRYSRPPMNSAATSFGQSTLTLLKSSECQSNPSHPQNWDISTMSNTIVPGSRWVMKIRYDGHFDIAGNSVASEIPGAFSRHTFFCWNPLDVGKENVYRLANTFMGKLTADNIIIFIKACIFYPFPPHSSCLPQVIHLPVEIAPFHSQLQKFFSVFPSPFSYKIDNAEHTCEQNTQLRLIVRNGMERANRLKDDGNAAYHSKDGLKAADAFHEAGNCVKDLLEQNLDKSEREMARRFLAICYANRANVWLLPGSLMDLRRCVEDAIKAENSDPSYSKSYIRQARGYQGLGEFDKAMDTIARALSREDLMYDVDLVKSLLILQTDGKGLPQTREEMEEWKRKILTGDVASAKRMKSVPTNGAWYRKVEGHCTNICRERG